MLVNTSSPPPGQRMSIVSRRPRPIVPRIVSFETPPPRPSSSITVRVQATMEPMESISVPSQSKTRRRKERGSKTGTDIRKVMMTEGAGPFNPRTG